MSYLENTSGAESADLLRPTSASSTGFGSDKSSSQSEICLSSISK